MREGKKVAVALRTASDVGVFFLVCQSGSSRCDGLVTAVCLFSACSKITRGLQTTTELPQRIEWRMRGPMLARSAQGAWARASLLPGHILIFSLCIYRGLDSIFMCAFINIQVRGPISSRSTRFRVRAPCQNFAAAVGLSGTLGRVASIPPSTPSQWPLLPAIPF